MKDSNQVYWSVIILLLIFLVIADILYNIAMCIERYPALPSHKTKITLSWQPVPDVDGYIVYYSLSEDLLNTALYTESAQTRPRDKTVFVFPNAWCDLHMKADRIQKPGFRVRSFADNWDNKGYRQSNLSDYISITIDPFEYRSRGEWCAPSIVRFNVR